MKYFLLTPMFVFSSMLMAQNQNPYEIGEKVIIDNDKMKVVEHSSVTEGDVCGAGMHHHEPHLVVLLTDAKVLMTPENGESQEVEVKSGTSIWFGEAETHSVVNIGDNTTKMLLIYLKDE